MKTISELQLSHRIFLVIIKPLGEQYLHRYAGMEIDVDPSHAELILHFHDLVSELNYLEA
jgi:hypothetical protein